MEVKVLAGNEAAPAPKLSIILPTYNRAKFLPAALEAIKGQKWQDWELIVIDDGSTDTTRELLPRLVSGWTQTVQYIYQTNQGAYGARNTGLDRARGKYVAFYDSDDVWLPHHLANCVPALEANPDIGWAFGACRVVDLATGHTRSPSTFYPDGRARQFLRLRTRSWQAFRIFDDSRSLRCLIQYGIFCGLQNSVIRHSVFAGRRFEVRYRNEAEDVLMAIRAMADGHRFGYFDDVHVIYHVHDTNSSAAGASTLEKSLRVHGAMVAGMEDLLNSLQLGRAEQLACRWALAQLCFWKVGYSLLWAHDQKEEALAMFWKSLKVWPWDFSQWKTYAWCGLWAYLGWKRQPSGQPFPDGYTPLG